MLDFDTAGDAALASSVRGAQWLVEMVFTSGTLRYTTHSVDIVAAGHTWLGYGNLVGVDIVRESEDGGAGDVVLSLSVVNAALIAASMGNVENYRNQPVRLYLQLIGSGYQPVGAPVRRWTGVMNKVRIRRDRGKTGSSTGAIEMVCSKAGGSRVRRGTGLRHTHAQHTARFAGDNGLEYIQTLIEKPAVWLTKKFQEI